MVWPKPPRSYSLLGLGASLTEHSVADVGKGLALALGSVPGSFASPAPALAPTLLSGSSAPSTL